MIENYINKHSIMGMLSKNYIPFENWRGFYKKKDKTKIVVFDENFSSENFEEVNYYYIQDKPEVKKKYYSTLLVSVFNNEFFELKGKENKELRETRNKWNKEIVIKYDIENIEDVINVIDNWDINSGVKYKWNKHSGYDRNFFRKYYEQEKKELISLFFYFGEKLIGYSIVSKIKEDDNCYRYIIRKMDVSVGRNVCLYIDYKTFEYIWRKENKKFLVNWGASSGNVLKYKKKFPIYLENRVWFYKRKKNNDEKI